MIPRTLKIRGHTYKIKQVARQALDADNVAEVDNETNVIRLYRRVAPSRKVELVLHEALHAMLDGYQVKNEEFIVITLGEALTDFIRSNPGFIRHALKTLGQ